MSRQCSGITREGRRCTVSVNGALGEEFCHLHDPSRAAERRKAASRAGRTRPASKEVRDLKEKIRGLIDAVEGGGLDRNDAAVMIQGYRALKDFLELERRIREQEDIEVRIEALERTREVREERAARWD